MFDLLICWNLETVNKTEMANQECTLPLHAYIVPEPIDRDTMKPPTRPHYYILSCDLRFRVASIVEKQHVKKKEGKTRTQITRSVWLEIWKP